MHVVRSELGERIQLDTYLGASPRRVNLVNSPLTMYVGPYDNPANLDSEGGGTAIPLRSDHYTVPFCEAGNRGDSGGWRLANYAELAAVQLRDRIFTPRFNSYLFDVANQSPVDLGPLAPDDAPLLPDIHSLLPVSPYNTSIGPDGGWRDGGGSANRGAKIFAGNGLSGPGLLRRFFWMVPRHHTPEYFATYYNNDDNNYAGAGYFHGAVYVCVKDDEENLRPRLPERGDARFPADEVEASPPYSRVLVAVIVSVVGKDHYWRDVKRNSTVALSFVGTPPAGVGLESQYLENGETRVKVVLDDPSTFSAGLFTIRAIPTFGRSDDLIVRAVDGIYFGDSKIRQGGNFAVNGVAGIWPGDKGAKNITARYQGVIRGMHVVRSELGSQMNSPQTDFPFHVGPVNPNPSGKFNGHYRTDGYQMNFCAKGNSGLGQGWRLASVAELAAVQLTNEIYVFKEGPDPTNDGVQDEVQELWADDFLRHLPSGEYRINLGLRNPGDAPLLPDMYATPSDLHGAWEYHDPGDGGGGSALGDEVRGGYNTDDEAAEGSVEGGCPHHRAQSAGGKFQRRHYRG